MEVIYKDDISIPKNTSSPMVGIPIYAPFVQMIQGSYQSGFKGDAFVRCLNGGGYYPVISYTANTGAKMVFGAYLNSFQILMASNNTVQNTNGFDKETILMDVNGDMIVANVVFAYGFTNRSSRELKENIGDISEETAKKILKLRPVHYNYIGQETENVKMGLIYEECRDILPEVCTKKEDDDPKNKGIEYQGLIPCMIKMIQIQQKEIEELKESIKS